MSPTVLKQGGYRFFFFSREEPRKHIHVISQDGEAKFWLEPEIELAKSYRYSSRDIHKMENIIKENYHDFIDSWEKYFGN